MSIICPTVTCQTDDIHEFRKQMEKVEFAERMQVDLMDGIFTPTKSPDIESIWFFENKVTDLHLMYKNPADVLNTVLDLKPNLLIVHAEADVHIPTLASAIKSADINFGLALLASTPVTEILDYIEYLDHVLIFSGELGKFGGNADLNLLRKIEQLREYKSDIEFGWDGGVNDLNVTQLKNGGVDVINVGGYLQNSDDAFGNYQKLINLLQS